MGDSNPTTHWVAVVAVSAITAAVISLGVTRFGKPEAAPPSPPPVTTVQVPEVIGMPAETASEVLLARNLRLVVAEQRHDADRTPGVILEQVPLAASHVDSETEVRVIVSSGPPEIRIPSIVGKPLEEAREQLATAGLRVGVVTEADGGTPGTVVAVVPRAGEIITPDRDVRLTVSAPGVDVPSFVGMPSRRAREKIQELGLAVGTIRQRFDDLRPPYVVLSQEPPEGTRVLPGSTVGLVVNEGD